MGFENKILSREISQLIWENGKTLGTAESCTGGRIAESIIAMPGASNYFKGGIVSYTNEIRRESSASATIFWKRRLPYARM